MAGETDDEGRRTAEAAAREVAQLALGALGARRLQATTPEARAALLEVELLLLAAWEARAVLAESDAPTLAAERLFAPALARLQSGAWPAGTAIDIAPASVDRRHASNMVELLATLLLALGREGPPRALGIRAESLPDGFRLELGWLRPAPSPAELGALRRNLSNLGGAIELQPRPDGLAVTARLRD